MAMAPEALTIPVKDPGEATTGGQDTAMPWGMPAAFWAWLQAQNPVGYTNALTNQQIATNWFNQWLDATGQAPEEEELEEGQEPVDTGEARQSILDALRGSFAGVFTDAEIDEIISVIIEPVLLGQVSDADIIRLIRDTEVHQRKFPGFKDRIANGHPGYSEFEYMTQRAEAKRAVRNVLGYDLSDELYGIAWANDLSVDEIGHKANVWKQVEDLGGPLKDFFMEEFDVSLSDKDLADLVDSEKDTAEWDEMFEEAFFRRYLNNLGVTQEVTKEMAAKLRTQGVTLEQAASRYQNLARSLPQLDRLMAIDSAISGDGETKFNSFQQAFEAMALLEPEDMLQVGLSISREIARFTPGGRVATDQSGRALGLVTPSQRQLLG